MNETTLVRSEQLVETEAANRVAVYHRDLGGLCLLDAVAYELLTTFESPRSIPSAWLEQEADAPEVELIQQLALRGFLVEPGKECSATRTGQGKVSVVQLVLTNSCNFGCTYCFEGLQGADAKDRDAVTESQTISAARLLDRTRLRVDRSDSVYSSQDRLEHQYDPKNRLMKGSDAVVYAKRAVEVAKATGAQEVMLQFFGGEPMINWRAIRAVLEAVGFGDSEIAVKYSMVTNGSLMSDEAAAVLARYRVGVCVSIDSVNGRNRPLKNGEDSTPVVREGLSTLHQHGNYIAINVALTSQTWSEFDESIVDLAVEYGAREIGVVVDFDPTFYDRWTSTEIAEKLWSVVDAGARRGVIVTGYWHQIFQVLCQFDAVATRGFKNCSAKGAQLSIEPNGSVFSCKAGSGLFGSIHEGRGLLSSPVYLNHASLRHSNPAVCRGCAIEGFCGGFCLGPIEKKFGSVDAVEADTCGFYREITKKLIASLAAYDVATFDLGSPATHN